MEGNILETFGKWLAELCSPIMKMLLNLFTMALNVWNGVMEYVFALLGTAPSEFRDGTLWNKIADDINPVFIAVGANLVVVFFVVGFCAESVDVKEEIRLDTILRLFIRLSICEYLVINFMDILDAVFKSIAALTNYVGASAAGKLKMTSDMKDTLYALPMPDAIFIEIAIFFASMIIIISAFTIAYTVYMHFIKMFLAIPYAALAFSTIAGNRAVARTAESYLREFLAQALEVVTIAIAIILCNLILSTSFMNDFGLKTDSSSWTSVLLSCMEMAFTCTLTAASAKSAQEFNSRVFGLRG